ncbi:hypothetical protein M9458_014765, partial [Cirrhinus mrigala]
TKNPVELAERLRAVCGNQSNAYTRLLEYRLNALRGLWGAQRQLALEEQQEHDGGPTTRRWPCLSGRASCNLNITTILITLRCPPAPTRHRLPHVSGSCWSFHYCSRKRGTTLRSVASPLSLGKEPADCLNGLERLLCSWLEEKSETSADPTAEAERSCCTSGSIVCK